MADRNRTVQHPRALLSPAQGLFKGSGKPDFPHFEDQEGSRQRPGCA
jgi:hypothetical protein